MKYIYSKYCIDERRGFKYIDCETGIEYKKETLSHLKPEILRRIIIRPNKIGREVIDL